MRICHCNKKMRSFRNMTGSQSRTTGEIFPSLRKSKSHRSLIKPASTASEIYYTAHPDALLEDRSHCSLTAWDRKDEILILPPSSIPRGCASYWTIFSGGFAAASN